MFSAQLLALSPLILCYVQKVSSQVASMTPIAYTNSSSTTTGISTALISCPSHCYARANALGLYFYSSVVTNVVATLVVTISATNGINSTTTSLFQNTTSFVLPSDAQAFSNAGWQDSATTINATTTELAPGTTLTWPTAYAAVANIFVFADCTFSGQPLYTVTAQLPSGGSEILLTIPSNATDPETTDVDVPAEYLVMAGLDPSSCTVVGDGVPHANIPVLSLTATTTILQGDLGPSLSGSSLYKVQSTSVVNGASNKPSISTGGALGTRSESISVTVQAEPDFTSVSMASSEATHSSNPGSSYITFESDSKSPQPSSKLPTPVTPQIPSVLTPASTAVTASQPDSIVSLPVPVVTIGGLHITPSGTELIVGAQTLVPGSVITVSGLPVSLAPEATVLVIGTSSIPLEPLAGVTVSPEQPQALTIEGFTATADSQSAYLIGGQTLVPGGSAITVSGAIVSLGPAATAIIVGTTKIPLEPQASISVLPEVVTIGGVTLTANSQSDFIIGGQTLVPGGPAITVSGTLVSLAPSATELVVGTLTEAVSPPSSTGLAGLIISGLASMAPVATSTNSLGAPFQGSGNSLDISGWDFICISTVLACVIVNIL